MTVSCVATADWRYRRFSGVCVGKRLRFVGRFARPAFASPGRPQGGLLQGAHHRFCRSPPCGRFVGASPVPVAHTALLQGAHHRFCRSPPCGRHGGGSRMPVAHRVRSYRVRITAFVGAHPVGDMVVDRGCRSPTGWAPTGCASPLFVGAHPVGDLLVHRLSRSRTGCAPTGDMVVDRGCRSRTGCAPTGDMVVDRGCRSRTGCAYRCGSRLFVGAHPVGDRARMQGDASPYCRSASIGSRLEALRAG
jgi:hypothetical protein